MTTPTRSGIPTTFRGTNFRSRLEARWAAFFDLVGWSWIYEPVDTGGYLPDFMILGERPFFVEVGPCISRAEYEDKSRKADSAGDELGRDVLIVGPSPVAWRDNLAFPTAGLLGERHDDAFWWDAGLWHRCVSLGCGAVAVHHSYGAFTSRPCGHYDGDHFLGSVDPESIVALWNRAGNDVQWRGPQSVRSILQTSGWRP